MSSKKTKTTLTPLYDRYVFVRPTNPILDKNCPDDSAVWMAEMTLLHNKCDTFAPEATSLFYNQLTNLLNHCIPSDDEEGEVPLDFDFLDHCRLYKIPATNSLTKYLFSPATCTLEHGSSPYPYLTRHTCPFNKGQLQKKIKAVQKAIRDQEKKEEAEDELDAEAEEEGSRSLDEFIVKDDDMEDEEEDEDEDREYTPSDDERDAVSEAEEEEEDGDKDKDKKKKEAVKPTPKKQSSHVSLLSSDEEDDVIKTDKWTNDGVEEEEDEDAVEEEDDENAEEEEEGGDGDNEDEDHDSDEIK